MTPCSPLEFNRESSPRSLYKFLRCGFFIPGR
jgi:hypothetical protein